MMGMMAVIVMMMGVQMLFLGVSLVMLAVSSAHFSDLGCSIYRDMHCNSVLLMIGLSLYGEKVVGAINYLSRLRDYPIAGIVDVKSLIDMGNISMNKSLCLWRN
jgi:hypothetical protein